MNKRRVIQLRHQELIRRAKLRKRFRRNRRIHRDRIRKDKLREELRRRFGQHSKILRMLEEHAKNPLQVRYGVHITVPKTFSIIDHPEQVIKTISQFAAVKCSVGRPTEVYIDQSGLKNYDLAASALLDLVAVELKNELIINNKATQFRGKLPNDGDVQTFIRAIGIIKHLGISNRIPTWSEMQKLRVFDRRNRHYSRPVSAKTASRKERAASGFVDHINECLAIKGKVLTPRGITQLSGCIGELLDNAEEHAAFPDWSMLGYLDLKRKQPKVEIAIFNFGRSIAETFQELPSGHFALRSVMPYVRRHMKTRSVFTQYGEEELFTVMALQEHISSKNNHADSQRGHGTIQLLRFFQNIHQLCTGSQTGAEMTLVSGRTVIRFDGSHSLKKGVGSANVIAFNQKNSLDFPPSQEYVRRLNGAKFPGTIISIRFPLTNSMVKEEENDA